MAHPSAEAQSSCCFRTTWSNLGRTNTEMTISDADTTGPRHPPHSLGTKTQESPSAVWIFLGTFFHESSHLGKSGVPAHTVLAESCRPFPCAEPLPPFHICLCELAKWQMVKCSLEKERMNKKNTSNNSLYIILLTARKLPSFLLLHTVFFFKAFIFSDRAHSQNRN